jgi:hypothetical protein
MFDENDVKKKDIKKLNGSTYKDWDDFIIKCDYGNTTIYTLPNFIKAMNNGEINPIGILSAYVFLLKSI